MPHQLVINQLHHPLQSLISQVSAGRRSRFKFTMPAISDPEQGPGCASAAPCRSMSSILVTVLLRQDQCEGSAYYTEVCHHRDLPGYSIAAALITSS